ncbi:MAG: carboxypeptidase regulatory-like domain-containing protein [Betaproteobacteria bacterium]
MKSVLLALAVLLAAATASAQTAALDVTVVDPSGAVIVGARVTVAPGGARAASAHREVATDGRGEATFAGLPPGRYDVHVEATGFEPTLVRNVRVRTTDVRRTVKLPIAKIAERVDVGRDPRERASDLRSDAFATVLGEAEIQELPDDPDEMERQLKDMAGPGAVIRVNGFRGGRLPPKYQIQQIRFHRNMFAADVHEPGFISVDIITKPGFDAWRGAANLGLHGSALSARNAFAPVKPDERSERAGFSLSGPLSREKSSLALSADGLDAFDARTIVAALPSGRLADSIRRPNRSLNVSARLEQAVGKSQVLRAELQRNHTFDDELGVGDFDLPERAYSQTRDETVARLSTSGSIRKGLYNEFRFEWRWQDTAIAAASTAPAVLVLNAFDAGGAQIAGHTGSKEVEIADDLDIAVGRHAIRVGFLVDGGRYRTDQVRNGTGTFTFASLADYAAGRPTTFTRNVGNPLVETGELQSGAYVQDDIRMRQDLTVSLGARQELQTHIGGVHVAPRGGMAWSPFRSGRTTIRAGGGIFYDWFDAQDYQQAVQLDGTHQEISTIVHPGYPDPTLGGLALALPPGRVQIAPGLDQPELREAIVGVEQQLPGNLRLNAMYIHRRGIHQLRGVNVNAPLPDGARPDPSAGPVTGIESIAGSWFDGLSVNVNYARPDKHIFVAANYFLSRSLNESDSPFGLPADNFNLAAERGPAANDARHRFMSLANFPLPWNFRMGTAVRVQSGLPYDITTGRDENGDTVSNDRPAGVTRNSGRGTATVDVGARLSWSVGFGGAAPPPAGPRVRIVRGGDANPLGGMSGLDQNTKRFGLEIYVQAYNLLNHLNALNFSGVLTSPFYGEATSAASPRRVEIGTRLTF